MAWLRFPLVGAVAAIKDEVCLALMPPISETVDAGFPAVTLPSTAEHFACVRVAPGHWVGARGPFRQAAAPATGEVAFYLNDFVLSNPEPWWVPAESWELTGPPPLEDEPLTIDWRPMAREVFEKAFEEVLAGLRAGRWRKAVLAVPEKGHAAAGSPSALAARALRHHAANVCWPFVFHQGGSGLAGITPECLFSLRGDRLHTMALAGTARPAEQAEFESDAKQIREHQIVAEALRTKLGAWGEVTTGPREVLNIGGLIHFITRFEVRLSTVPNPQELVRTLHPTPAMGNLPRTPENLQELHAWRRRLALPPEFGAPFGVQWSGGVHMIVAIRGIWWANSEVTGPLAAGSSMAAPSTPNTRTRAQATLDQASLRP